MKTLQSWGRYPPAQQDIRSVYWTSENIDFIKSYGSVLAYGCGRSYGDCCLNDGGLLLETSHLDRFIFFNREEGYLKAEAGVTLADILELIVPCGWFLPVTPGTKFVTLGGAIANDVHGKNHHVAGSFGRHITEIEILRSDGTRRRCTQEDGDGWFEATVGGLGLTGLILTATIKLKPIRSPAIYTESIRFKHIEDFFDLSNESDRNFEYTVAWVDCLARGRSFGRGIYFRGNHSNHSHISLDSPLRKPLVTVPFDMPQLLLNYYSIKAFNNIYYHKSAKSIRKRDVHYDSFFFPLDTIGNWNRIYGKRGFMQYQCVVSDDGRGNAISKILTMISDSGFGSFLAILKRFGGHNPTGLLSFTRKGVTLALDFANIGTEIFSLFDKLDHIVQESDGAVYPAKDARMSKSSFKAYYHRLPDFLNYVDPKFSSSFWRRVT